MAEKEAPLVIVSDEDGTWRLVETVISNHLPLRRLQPPASLESIFKARDLQKPVIVENVNLRFKLHHGPVHRSADHEKHNRYTDPFLYLYILNCESKLHSTKDLRAMAMKWAESLKSQEFLIILVTPTLHKAKTLEKARLDQAEILFSRMEEKLKSKYRQRVVRLTSEQEVMHRIGEGLMNSFDHLLQAYEEDTLRSLEVKASQPVGWNYCSQYFPIRDGLASMLLQFNLPSFALLVYLNLETMLGKLQGNLVSFTGITTLLELRRYIQQDRGHLMFHLSQQAVTDYRNAIRLNQISELDMRVYLFAVLLRLSFAAQEHMAFLGRFESRLAYWVDQISTVEGVTGHEVALFEAAAHISMVKELEYVISSAAGCLSPTSPTSAPPITASSTAVIEATPSIASSAEFPNMTQFAGIARHDSMDSIGEVMGTGSVMINPDSSDGDDSFSPRKMSTGMSTGLSTPVSVFSTAISLQNSPWTGGTPHHATHAAARHDYTVVLSLQARQHCYAAMTTFLCRAQAKTVLAAAAMGLSLDTSLEPPQHVELDAVSPLSDEHRKTSLESSFSRSVTSHRSFVAQYTDLTRAARDYGMKAGRPGLVQQMSFQLALLCAQQGLHEEALQCFNSVLRCQHRSPWPSLIYPCHLYLRNCCSHLLRILSDVDSCSWPMQHALTTYLRSGLWLTGNSPSTLPPQLGPFLPLHPRRNSHHAVNPVTCQQPKGQPDPSQDEAWTCMKKGLKHWPSAPFVGSLSAVVDILSIEVDKVETFELFVPFTARVTLRSRIPEEVKASSLVLQLRMMSDLPVPEPPPVTVKEAPKSLPGLPLSLRKPSHGSSHSFDATHQTFLDVPRHQVSAQFRSASCAPASCPPLSPMMPDIETIPDDDEASQSDATSREFSGVAVSMSSTSSFALLCGTDTTIEVQGVAEHPGWYRAGSLTLNLQDIPLSLVEDKSKRDEFSHCDTWLSAPPQPYNRLTAVRLPANFSPDKRACTLAVFGRTVMKNFQLRCVEGSLRRSHLWVTLAEDEVTGDVSHIVIYFVFVDWALAAGSNENHCAKIKVHHSPQKGEKSLKATTSTFFGKQEFKGLADIYKMDDVVQHTNQFKDPLTQQLSPIGTLEIISAGDDLRLQHFALKESCPKCCAVIKVPVPADCRGHTVTFDSEFAYNSSSPVAEAHGEIAVPPVQPKFVASSHAVSLGSDVWLTLTLRMTARTPVRILAHRLTAPAFLAVHTSRLPADLTSHVISQGEEVNCVFGLTPSSRPVDYAVQGQLQLQYETMQTSSTASSNEVFSVPIEIRHRLPPVLSPNYKVCVTLTSNTGDFRSGITYPLDIYVFSLAETNQVNAMHHELDVATDITVQKGTTPWMTIGNLTQRLTLVDGKGKVQLFLVAMRAGTLPLPAVKLFSVPMHGFQKSELAMDLECPFREVKVIDIVPSISST